MVSTATWAGRRQSRLTRSGTVLSRNGPGEAEAWTVEVGAAVGLGLATVFGLATSLALGVVELDFTTGLPQALRVRRHPTIAR